MSLLKLLYVCAPAIAITPVMFIWGFLFLSAALYSEEINAAIGYQTRALILLGTILGMCIWMLFWYLIYPSWYEKKHD